MSFKVPTNPDDCQIPSSSRCMKRKKPDDESILCSGPLSENPIENEYEQLDEDEDADDETATQLKMKDLEDIRRAQEPATLTQYDDIKITPFNLEQELEEGNFDKAGNFIFSKKQKDTEENPNDNWAESVDWAEVEQKERERKAGINPNIVNKDEDMPQQTDRYHCYREMLKIMRPDETVQKAIRRIGYSIPKRQPKSRTKKSIQVGDQKEQAEEESNVLEAKMSLEKMIELAHQMLEEGDIDIYQKSFSDIEKASICQANT